MGESKHSVKNKARVEGSICATYCIVRPHTFALIIFNHDNDDENYEVMNDDSDDD